MNNVEPIAVVILAAGQARRMNAAKMLLPLHDDGRTMLDAAIAAASVICDKPIVVSGAYHHRIEAHLGRAQHTVLLIENQRWEEGMSSSISAGIRATKPSTTAALIVLADQPEVGAEQLWALVTAYENEGSIVATRYPGGAGVPAIFPRSFFSRLSAATNTGGAKYLLRSGEHAVTTVDFGFVPRDVDTPQDYRRLTGRKLPQP